VNVLGIETSCDETASAVVGARGVLSNEVYSQAVHAAYGGVVPELAARAHVEKVAGVTRAALSSANLEKPDAVAATAGPGLIGAVLVGLCFGKALAAGWRVPFIGVNHLEGHLLTALLQRPAPAWPFVSLVVSGGHTTLYACRGLGEYEVLATTVDDAVGECFDKVARMLELGYPGGPVVDRLAQAGSPTAVQFPRPLPREMNCSFSGLKTAVRNHLSKPDRASDADVCASFQAAAVDCLVRRTVDACRVTGWNRVALGGGVAANSRLRAQLLATGLEVFCPPIHLCTDNAAMIAHAGRLHLMAGRSHPLSLGAQACWSVA